jgi:murein hydrolase activator
MLRMRGPRFEIAIILFGACLAAPGAAAFAAADSVDSPTQRLHAVEQSAAESRAQRDNLAQAAAALAAEIEGLQQQSVSVADAMQRHEAALTMLEAQLISLAADAAAKTAALNREQTQRDGLLMALVALARHPPETLALASPDPVAAERSALVLGDAVPPLDRAAHRLNADLRQLAALRLAIARAQARHHAEQDLLTSQQLRLADLIVRKSQLQRQAQIGTEQGDEKLMALAAEAASLKDLIERLDAAKRRDVTGPESPPKAIPNLGATPTPVAAPAAIPAGPAKPTKLKSFLYAPGNYLVPASGKLVQSFGQPNDVGLTSQGLAYETRSGGQVVAPYDGRVLFAGPFRGYGQILIIEHDGGYDSLIAGLERLDVSVGQWLITGEPVGIMPKGEEKPRLYLELRHDGQPINPLPWLATSNEKVSG